MRMLATAALLMVTQGTLAAADDLQWMAGQWCGIKDGILNEEVWLAPRAGSLIGMHRDSKDAKFLGFEYFRIVEENGELVYWTQPGGRPPIAFRAKSASKDSVSFLNPQHDFPKRITYRRADADTLVARIDDGTDNGQSMEWRWRRVVSTASGCRLR